MLYGIRTFISQIKNLIRWFPIIWNDRDWDHHYIFDILKTKLQHQAEYIGKKDRHTRAKYDAERMMLCVRLIEKIQQEYYSLEYTDYSETKFNWIKSKTHPNLYELDIQMISERYDDYFNKHKVATRIVKNNKKYQIWELTPDKYKDRLAMNVAQYNELRAQSLLFKILDKNIQSWWE
jgi:hypothetical protein